MEEYKALKQQLVSVVQGQMANLDCVDAKELGEVVDMIKDFEEAMYYCSIVKAMEESKEEKENNEKYDEIATSLLARAGGNQSAEMKYYTQPYYPMWDDPYIKRNGARVRYYDGGNGNTQGMRGYDEPVYNNQYIRDPKEGRAGQYRKGYMEGKEQHLAKEKQVQELEKYMHELSEDVTEMIKGASPEEKAMLQNRLTTLATKVANA